MSKRILLIYGTKTGTTAGIADAIAQTLGTHGLTVVVAPVEQAPAIEGYNGVIVGSAIRGGSWLPEMIEYVKANAKTLRGLPLAYFTVCLTLKDDTPENRELVDTYLKPVREIVPSQAEAFFAGAMDFSRLSFPVRLMIKAMKAPQGDFRNWEAIREWALGLSELFNTSNETLPA